MLYFSSNDSDNSLAWALVYCKIGDPPPILSYAALLLGARRLAIKEAITFCKGESGPGNRIISGSAKRLYRNSSTSSPVVGPPRFKKRTPSPPSLLSSSVGDTIDGDDSEIPVAALNSVVLLLFVVDRSEDVGGKANRRDEVLRHSLHLLLPLLTSTADKAVYCGLVRCMKADA